MFQRELRHDNIVRFIGFCRNPDENTIHILTEFCPFGDLSDYMKSRAKPGWSRQLAILHEIAFGVSYLHDRMPAIIHRDLKSLNILVDSSEHAKIADFGLSKTRSKIRAKYALIPLVRTYSFNAYHFRMHTVVGTINWQAPEMWVEQPTYTEKVDVYSCGLIFWEVLMWAKTYPFADLSDAQIYEKGTFLINSIIHNSICEFVDGWWSRAGRLVGKLNIRPAVNTLKRYPKEILNVMEEMWAADPDDRPSMSAVLSRLSAMMG
jgi:serine/threonine protein kinase